MTRVSLCFLLALSMIISSSYVDACEYQGIEFPACELSFADQVVSYEPNPGDVGPPHNNPTSALGEPDFVSGEDAVALGDEGVLVIRFSDNSLTTSGDNAEDLWIFESGGQIEPTDIFISTDSLNWIYVGATNGATSGIDIDASIGNGVVLGEQYSFVKIVDLLPRQSVAPYGGADIDAVGAISSDVAVPFLTISPPSGSYTTTQRFDFTLILETSGLSAVDGSATFDGSDVTSSLLGCLVPGTLLSGGQTFRCPGLSGRFLGAGSHTLNVTVNLSDGSSVDDNVTWEVLENSEP